MTSLLIVYHIILADNLQLSANFIQLFHVAGSVRKFEQSKSENPDEFHMSCLEVGHAHIKK